MMDKRKKKLLAFVGLLSLICLFYPVGTALAPIVFIVDGIVGVVYGKKWKNRKLMALFTYVLILGVVSLPLFLLFIFGLCYGGKFD